MQTKTTVPFSCPTCGTQQSVAVTTIIDPNVNPQAKSMLLSGQLNTVQCNACGTASTASSPLVYHDASKELLITFAPMQMGTSQDESERMIGAFMRELTGALDQKLIKGYILQPRRSLTLQGLIEQVLEADGVTKEMMEAQKERSRLVQLFLQTDPSTYEALVKEHDDKIDMEFFQTMSVVAQRYAQNGRPDAAEQILAVQQRIAELSTAGQELLARTARQDTIINEVAEALTALGDKPTPQTVVQMIMQWVDDEDKLQAAVGLARPLFEYNFFQELAAEIGRAPAEQRESLEKMRDNLLELTKVIDEQSQAQLQAAANVLRQIIGHPNPEEAVRSNLAQIDETVMAVLDMNIQEAERQQDVAAASHLKSVRDVIMRVIQANMQPEIRFINDLLSANSPDEADKMVEEKAPEFGAGLLEVFDAVSEVVAAQGQMQLVAQLKRLREKTEEVLA